MTVWTKTNPESLQEFYYSYEIVTTEVDAVAHRDAKSPPSRSAPNDLGMLTAIDIRRRAIMGSHFNIANFIFPRKLFLEEWESWVIEISRESGAWGGCWPHVCYEMMTEGAERMCFEVGCEILWRFCQGAKKKEVSSHSKVTERDVLNRRLEDLLPQASPRGLKRYSGVWTTKRHVPKEASAKFSQARIRVESGCSDILLVKGVMCMGGYTSNPPLPKDNEITDV